jgi:hypothetical protein
LELGSDSKGTLEQIAAGPGTKLTYTYDFGGDWEHVITVEDTAARADAALYRRCIGGCRKAPPEDCCGIWGYQELLAILTGHPRRPRPRRTPRPTGMGFLAAVADLPSYTKPRPGDADQVLAFGWHACRALDHHPPA